MFEKYNEKARRALFFARYEASKLGSRVIESEHILLGILREGEETVSEIFRRFQVKPEDIRREIEGSPRPPSFRCPRNPRRSSPTPRTRPRACCTRPSGPSTC
jgi:ATP-dependent Clp protease ATP-binding subunit ClpA